MVYCNKFEKIEKIQKIKDFLKTIGTPENIELLPYHAMGENKYRAIGEELQIFKTSDDEKMKQLKEIFA